VNILLNFLIEIFCGRGVLLNVTSKMLSFPTLIHFTISSSAFVSHSSIVEAITKIGHEPQYESGQEINLASIELTISLADVYRDVNVLEQELEEEEA
jgi:hypothetical protein